jgi:hypothetical protein
VITRGGLSEQAWRPELEPQGIQLLDDEGKVLQRIESQTQEAGGQVSYELLFMAPNRQNHPPTKLLWQIPLEPREQLVRFELNDLPISGK